jgi:hypothetical protein
LFVTYVMSALYASRRCGGCEVVLDHADREAEEIVERRHPLGVATREVIVDGDEVDAAAEQRVRVHRERGDERLAFARLHLGDFAFVQHLAAHDLDVEVAHVQDAFAGLAAHGEHLGQHRIELFAGGETLFEFGRLQLQFGVGERGDFGLEGVRRRDRAPQARDLAFVRVEESLEEGHFVSILGGGATQTPGIAESAPKGPGRLTRAERRLLRRGRRRSRTRQDDPEGAPFVLLRADLDPAAVHFDDLLRDVEAHAGPGDPAGAGVRGAPETREDTLEVLRRNADASVGHRHGDLSAGAVRHHAHADGTRRVLERVAHHVVDRVAQADRSNDTSTGSAGASTVTRSPARSSVAAASATKAVRSSTPR